MDGRIREEKRPLADRGWTRFASESTVNAFLKLAIHQTPRRDGGPDIVPNRRIRKISGWLHFSRIVNTLPARVLQSFHTLR
jgi:hypothetical protein